MPRKIIQKNLKYTAARGARTETQDPSQPSTSSGNSSLRRLVSSSSSDTSESDEDFVTSTSSSRNRSHVEQSQELSAAEESRLVSDCAFYLLVCDQRKYAIKRADIVKNAFKEHRKQYKKVMEKVETYLKQVMGLKLHELEGRKGQYILVNEMKAARDFAEISKDEKIKLGLLMIVLAIIFMSEDYVPESDLWKALNKVGIDPDTKHPVFGDVKKLLTQEFVRQLYLEYKRENSHPPVFVFSWGPRAKIEISKLEVLQFVCDIYGDNMNPQHWPNQYNDAMKSAQPMQSAQPLEEES